MRIKWIWPEEITSEQRDAIFNEWANVMADLLARQLARDHFAELSTSLDDGHKNED